MELQLKFQEPAQKNLRQTLQTMIAALILGKNLTEPERAVLTLLHQRWGKESVTQNEICRSEKWLGCHPKHEADIVRNALESTQRQVRAIVRRLRLKHKIPVLSDHSGYRLPESDADAKKFVQGMERTAKARAAASLETYRAMKEKLGITSKIFDQIENIQTRKTNEN